MKKLRLAVWTAVLILGCAGVSGCARTMKNVACGAAPFSWDPTTEVCRDGQGREIAAGCCDKEPTGR